jgi:hypothetical protein
VELREQLVVAEPGVWSGDRGLEEVHDARHTGELLRRDIAVDLDDQERSADFDTSIHVAQGCIGSGGKPSRYLSNLTELS